MQKRVGWVLVILVALVLTVAAVSYTNWLKESKRELEMQETAMTISLSRLRAETDDLNNQIAKVGSSEYVEKIARAEYHFLRDGELRFSFTNEEMLDVYTEEEQAILDEELGV